MPNTLKYENTVEENKLIKAYDFEPMEGRTDRYVVGRVVRKGELKADYQTFKGYEVEVLKDTAFPEGARKTIYVPYETTFDYDGRVLAVDEVE